MFRELRRRNQEIPTSECIELLKIEKRGTLSVIGDNGYPYGMPMNHFYNEDDGKIYFHCGTSGYREDALKRNNRVSFCVCEAGKSDEGEWALKVRSVIVFGRVDIVNDMATVVDITARLSRKFTDDEEYIRAEIQNHADRTVLLRLSPEHISGKLVTEA